VEDARELFERTGFEVEPFGGRTVIMHAAPAPHPTSTRNAACAT
jgi:hypothetical protein